LSPKQPLAFHPSTSSTTRSPASPSPSLRAFEVALRAPVGDGIGQMLGGSFVAMVAQYPIGSMAPWCW